MRSVLEVSAKSSNEFSWFVHVIMTPEHRMLLHILEPVIGVWLVAALPWLSSGPSMNKSSSPWLAGLAEKKNEVKFTGNC